jgi:hypothetical protein
MSKRILIVDGMLSGTGIRDAVAGGYIEPNEVGLSVHLANSITKWLLNYESAHYRQFMDKAENEQLDHEGVSIARQIRKELPGTQVGYFSNADMRKVAIE